MYINGRTILIHIDSEKDFDKVRNIDSSYYREVYLAINKSIKFTERFEPIDARNLDIIIKGNNHTLCNFNIDIDRNECAGLFSQVNSIQVYDLNVKDFNIKGGVQSGSLVGRAEKAVLVKNSTFEGKVDSEAFGGGIAGSTDAILIENSEVKADVTGLDVVGGVVGLTTIMYASKNNVGCNVKAVGKAVGVLAGYYNKKGERTLEEAIEYLPKNCPYAELKREELKKAKRNTQRKLNKNRQ